jgi:hypothetical protein
MTLCIHGRGNEPCPDCSAINNRTTQLVEEIRAAHTALEERVTFAEQARDNALSMRDAADARRKLAGESAGRRIKELVKLARHLAAHHPVMCTEVEGLIGEILSKDKT